MLCRTCVQGSEVPDILPLSHSTPYSGSEGDPPGFDGAGPQAQELTQQACHGTDPTLALLLPHTRATQGKRGGTEQPCINNTVLKLCLQLQSASPASIVPRMHEGTPSLNSHQRVQ